MSDGNMVLLKPCRVNFLYMVFVLIVFVKLTHWLTLSGSNVSTYETRDHASQDRDVFPKHVDNEQNNWSDIMKCQAYRQNRLREQCDALGLTRNLSVMPEADLQEIAVRFMVDEYHNLIMKSIPKTGCSSWKQIIMENHPHYEQHRDVWEHDWKALRQQLGLTTLDRYQKDEILYKLQNYFTILTVRHPLMRLESYFKNKMIDEGRLGERVLTNKSRFYEQKMGVYFQKELDWFLSQPVMSLNQHFAPYTTKLARECVIPFRFISKTETAFKEMEYVIKHHLSGKGSPRKVNSSHNVTEPSGEPRADGGIVLPLFSKLEHPQQTLQDLDQVFSEDMKIFGYGYKVEGDQVIATCDSYSEFGYCC